MIDLSNIEGYLKQNLTDFDENVLHYITDLKHTSIDNIDEINANYYWYLEHVYKIKKDYVFTYQELKASHFESAWNRLDQIDITIGNICENFDLYSNDLFGLLKIRNQIHELQKLFPYIYFLSREMVILKERCSVCGKENTLRNHCDHIPGKLYMGQLCAKIIEKANLKAIAIVKKPFDKYAILKPDGKEYNYNLLEHLMKYWKDPYDYFRVETHKEKKPEYVKIGRNDLCPCSSGLKYKKCCMGTEKELYTHQKILFSHYIDPIPEISGSTWK